MELGSYINRGVRWDCIRLSRTVGAWYVLEREVRGDNFPWWVGLEQVDLCADVAEGLGASKEGLEEGGKPSLPEDHNSTENICSGENSDGCETGGACLLLKAASRRV